MLFKSFLFKPKFKNWKNYFTEFLMLFLAITLGFFAENVREEYKIKRVLSENYNSLITDLRRDSLVVSRDVRESEQFQNLNELHNALYEYHNNDLSWKNLKNKLFKIGPLPAYTTLYINNSTYKNIQSSGLLSSIQDKEFRTRLSFYYEVLFKRVSDNNKNFDRVGIEFFNKQFPFLPFEVGNYFFNQTILKKPKNYKSFILNLEESKNILTSEKLIYQLNSYTSEMLYYQSIKSTVYKRNQEILDYLHKTKP